MKSLGICAGASTISLAGLQRNDSGAEILFSHFKAHDGNPRRVLRELLGQIEDLQEYKIGVTGRKFRNVLNFSTLSEPEALELATGFILPPHHPYRVIISAGGETTMVYHLDDDGKVDEIIPAISAPRGRASSFCNSWAACPSPWMK
jgi:hypothetical protein